MENEYREIVVTVWVDGIPHEIWKMIFDLGDLLDLIMAGRTCHLWRRATTEVLRARGYKYIRTSSKRISLLAVQHDYVNLMMVGPSIKYMTRLNTEAARHNSAKITNRLCDFWNGNENRIKQYLYYAGPECFNVLRRRAIQIIWKSTYSISFVKDLRVLMFINNPAAIHVDSWTDIVMKAVRNGNNKLAIWAAGLSNVPGVADVLDLVLQAPTGAEKFVKTIREFNDYSIINRFLTALIVSNDFFLQGYLNGEFTGLNLTCKDGIAINNKEIITRCQERNCSCAYNEDFAQNIASATPEMKSWYISTLDPQDICDVHFSWAISGDGDLAMLKMLADKLKTEGGIWNHVSFRECCATSVEIVRWAIESGPVDWIDNIDPEMVDKPGVLEYILREKVIVLTQDQQREFCDYYIAHRNLDIFRVLVEYGCEVDSIMCINIVQADLVRFLRFLSRCPLVDKSLINVQLLRVGSIKIRMTQFICKYLASKN
jgi:hypothetical protein